MIPVDAAKESTTPAATLKRFQRQNKKKCNNKESGERETESRKAVRNVEENGSIFQASLLRVYYMQALDNVCNKHFTLLMMGERLTFTLISHSTRGTNRRNNNFGRTLSEIVFGSARLERY